MNRIPSFRVTTLSLALLSLVLVAFGILNYQQRDEYQIPDDGVSWVDNTLGITAWIVAKGGPAERAGIHEGDLLKAINGQPVTTQAEVAQEDYRLGVWTLTTYSLTRNGEPFDTSLVLSAQPTSGSIRNGGWRWLACSTCWWEPSSFSGAGRRESRCTSTLIASRRSSSKPLPIPAKSNFSTGPSKG